MWTAPPRSSRSSTVGVVLTADADAYTQGPPAQVVETARAAGLERIFLYGPALVDASARGHGVLRAMTEQMLRRAAGRFDAAVGFAEEANEASAGAHSRLGWETVGTFTWQDRVYSVIAHPTIR